MQVAIATGHDLVDGRLTRSGTHRNTSGCPLNKSSVPARVPVDCVERSNNVSSAGEHPSFRNAAADDKYKVTDDGDMKARCRRAQKRAQILWVTAKTVSLWQTARSHESAPRYDRNSAAPRLIRTL